MSSEDQKGVESVSLFSRLCVLNDQFLYEIKLNLALKSILPHFTFLSG